MGLLLAVVPLIALSVLGAKSAVEILILGSMTYAILQTIAFSLYLYAAELYPTRLRAIGTAYSSAWLRAGSSIGPLMVGFIVSGFDPFCVCHFRGHRADWRLDYVDFCH